MKHPGLFLEASDESHLIEYLDRIGFMKPNTAFIHGVWLTPREIEILARTGVSVQHNPTSNLKVGSGLAPIRALIEGGVNVSMGTDGCGLVVANPVPLDAELDRALHDRTVTAGIAAARAADVHGKEVTPFLLEFFHRETGGQSVTANVALVRDNARLAAAVAVELASH